jgi:hypothetical protein
MPGWALIFFSLAILSAYLGFFGPAGPRASSPPEKWRAKFFGTDLGITHCKGERTSDPVRPSPFDTPHRVSSHFPKIEAFPGTSVLRAELTDEPAG